MNIKDIGWCLDQLSQSAVLATAARDAAAEAALIIRSAAIGLDLPIISDSATLILALRTLRDDKCDNNAAALRATNLAQDKPL